MTTTSTSTARRILAATALSAVSFAGFTGLAAAETPPFQPGPVIVAPAPQPDPEPQPQPVPQPDLPIGQPEVEPEPHPQPGPVPADLPVGQPEPQPDPEPEAPTENDDITADPCTLVTHGCGDDDSSIDDLTSADDEPGQPDGHCFDEFGEVVDPSECVPFGDDGLVPPADEPVDEPETGDEPKQDDRGALPRTGAGLALLAGIGSVLVGGGAAAKRAAKR